MMKLVSRLNNWINLVVMLLVFWSLFWLLNGFDKFFNGSMEPMIEPGLEKGVVTDADGSQVGTLYGYEINGLFGSNRNAKTITFFERIGIPNSISLPLLYIVALFEIMLTVIFLSALGQYLRKKKSFEDCMSLAYKLSVSLFVVFCTVDILIGERIELWEHTTFIVALLASYWFSLFSISEETPIADLTKTKPKKVDLAGANS